MNDERDFSRDKFVVAIYNSTKMVIVRYKKGRRCFSKAIFYQPKILP